LILGILFPPKGLYDLISDNWGGIPDFVSGIWDWIVQAFQNGFDLVIRSYSLRWDWLNSFSPIGA